ncbi:S-phase kinase-associated protein 1-like [Cucurbita pepo subsp. pepo]|uniref:S-phase kinase-associated protein 1-like n=1 Tax=Cucurbita pepo subsp. pepo TaxID=3664 RepID=UPI000C9D555F|nr:S-phase kinase-associated protein 1-like [Cucurbita pepo subsp. pepo]
MRTFQLKSSDNKIFKVSEEIAIQSAVIKSFLEDFGSDSDEIVIPLPNVSGRILEIVIEWIVKHADDELTKEEVQDWENKFMNDLNMEVTTELVMAANYLEVIGLLHRTCQSIADQISGKSPEEIRRILNITNDFTPEEEAEIREQNGWDLNPSTTDDGLFRI